MKRAKFIIFILFIAILFSGCGKKEEVVKKEPINIDELKPGLVVRDASVNRGAVKEVGEQERAEDVVKNTQLANPASVLCEKLGYKIEMRTGDEGTAGYCVFDNGDECDEWAFFRNECGQENRKISMDMLAKHSDKGDCWLVVENKAYDVSSFIASHPGGEAILKGCGKDATSLFNKKPSSGKPHSDKANEMLADYYLAELVK
jgi:cytochrome b involved in lipid metabolism